MFNLGQIAKFEPLFIHCIQQISTIGFTHGRDFSEGFDGRGGAESFGTQKVHLDQNFVPW